MVKLLINELIGKAFKHTSFCCVVRYSIAASPESSLSTGSIPQIDKTVEGMQRERKRTQSERINL